MSIFNFPMSKTKWIIFHSFNLKLGQLKDWRRDNSSSEFCIHFTYAIDIFHSEQAANVIMWTAPDEILPHCHRAYANGKTIRKTDKKPRPADYKLVYSRTDLMSQCGINITVQRNSLFHDIDFPCAPGGWGPNSSSYRVTCKRYCVSLRVERSKIYISALPYINISRLRIHRLRKWQFPVDSVKFFTLSCLRLEVWCVWVEF